MPLAFPGRRRGWHPAGRVSLVLRWRDGVPRDRLPRGRFPCVLRSCGSPSVGSTFVWQVSPGLTSLRQDSSESTPLWPRQRQSGGKIPRRRQSGGTQTTATKEWRNVPPRRRQSGGIPSHVGAKAALNTVRSRRRADATDRIPTYGARSADRWDERRLRTVPSLPLDRFNGLSYDLPAFGRRAPRCFGRNCVSCGPPSAGFAFRAGPSAGFAFRER